MWRIIDDEGILYKGTKEDMYEKWIELSKSRPGRQILLIEVHGIIH